MFDVITGQVRHIPGGGAGPVLVSTGLHALMLGAIITVPLLLVRDMLPEVPTIMAFVAAVPAPPPPPPPPPPPAPKSAEPPRTQPAVSPSAVTIPLEAPVNITPEPAGNLADVGVPGGVEGGVPGGVVGGFVGGIVDDAPPPPPPPPPPAPRGPVRIGGQIQPPTLVYRVEPVYPALAVAAHVQGTVILETIVNTEGRVTEVKVLRSIGLLDRAAIDAVKQWRYSPVILNGTPVPFILTVVVSFSAPLPGRQVGKY
jgi:protein TonB